MKLRIIVFCLVFFSSTLSFAHQTGASQFIAHVQPESSKVDTLTTFPTADVAHHLQLDADEDGALSDGELRSGWSEIEDYLDASIDVRTPGAACRTIERKTSPVEKSAARMWYLEAFECPGDMQRVTFENVALTETVGGYRHMGRIQLGDRIHTTIFSREFPTFTLSTSAGDESGRDDGGDTSADAGDDAGIFDQLLRYGWEGILHIVLGIDHVLFVLTLILISRRTRRLVYVVTSFTVAHSITLAVSALDLFTIAPAVVEPVIAASIAYVAIEAMVRESEPRYLFLPSFVFGLIHGFGFSYVLRDEIGLPTESLLPALFSFNVGVELGQLAIVLLLFPLRRSIREKEWETNIVRIFAGVILLVSLYWLVERIFFV